ncbi:phthiocerol/phthiodiolone dimycocerosyl transferase family protein [Mycolicibacterium litorale]|uniref:phthiocerol/phthiodiolone dimycocerosyl transferase family protein n=1 Tax=Mycolicibacterium litorale TaxID=758802 RepID=UPI003CF4628B
MFPTSAIRSLARSEEMFAETHNFVALTAHVTGPVDVDAMSAAFDALLEAHPVLAGHLEPLPDGHHQIVVDDLMPPGIDVVELDDAAADPPRMHLDQNAALAHLRLTIRDGQAQPTFFIHHCLADGHHQFSFVEELFSWYTELVCTGSLRPIDPQPAPVPLEAVLAERGIHKLRRSGLERFMPAMFAYELPPSRRATNEVHPALPSHVPVARCRLSERETRELISFCRTHRLRTNAVLSAAILLAEWQVRETPHIPVPYIYPVDLRYFLSPPLAATACTNPLGVATYLAEIDRKTDIAGLAREIAEAFQADLAEGVIQQSLLHFSPQYVGNPPGLPDIVMFTDNGPIPAVSTPPEMTVTGCHSDMYFGVDAGIDMYSSGIIADRVFVEHHAHAPAPERSIDAIASLLRSIAEQHAATGVR